jgi:hypothetical protein
VPWLRILVLAFALAHATGLSDLIEVACDDDCAEQSCDDGCPPICPTCHCVRCPTGITSSSGADLSPRPPPVSLSSHRSERTPASPEPSEILRVPIAGLA